MSETTLFSPARRFRIPGITIWQKGNWIVRIAMLVALALVVLTIAAPLIAPFDPKDQSLISRLRPPIGFERYKSGYFLGTDELGRDILSRCIYGLRLTFSLALAGAIVSLLIGGTLGLLAGISGGRTDDVIMGLVDAQIAIPMTLIALLILSVFGSSIQIMIFVLGLYGWEQFARISAGRGEEAETDAFCRGSPCSRRNATCALQLQTYPARMLSRRWWFSSP